jgi:transcriptional regulator with XRE-family HTH domain
MPNKPSAIDPVMAQLPAALKARMKEKGHVQEDVERITGIPQPQISKVLKGCRKRLTEPMRLLCRYACLEIEEAGPDTLELSQLLQRVVESSPAAADCVRTILQSLVVFEESRGIGSKSR